jgi:6,7-dimethyl-8-ribityllumazine synthase
VGEEFLTNVPPDRSGSSIRTPDDRSHMVALGLVVARFNKERPVTPKMAERARAVAAERDAELVAEVPVPGSYDAPLAADRLARRDDVDAVAVLGAIVTGDTDHDRVIGQAAATQLASVAREHDTPVTLGVTGPGQSAAEAAERVHVGADAVEAALDLARDLPEPGADLAGYEPETEVEA